MTQSTEGAGAGQYQLICGMIAIAPLVYMGVVAGLKFGGVLPEGGMGAMPEGSENTISLALLAAGVTSSLASILIRKLVLQGDRKETPAGRFQGILVSMAVSESGAVLGLVLMLLTGNLLYGSVLCGLSFAITCFHFPSRYWLEHGDKAL